MNRGARPAGRRETPRSYVPSVLRDPPGGERAAVRRTRARDHRVRGEVRDDRSCERLGEFPPILGVYVAIPDRELGIEFIPNRRRERGSA